MKSFNFLLISFLLSLSISAFSAKVNYEPALLVLKNGEKIECQAEQSSLFYSKTKYRLSENDKKKKIPSEEIQHAIFYTEGENGPEVSTIIENILYLDTDDFKEGKIDKTNEMKAYLIDAGEITLYITSVSTYHNGAWFNTIDDYYCKKENDDYAVHANRSITYPKGFIKTKEALKVEDNFEKVYDYFFGDYPELIEQIKNGTLTGNNIADIVSEYNAYKESKSKKK